LEASQFSFFYFILFFIFALMGSTKRFAYQHRSHPCEKVDSSSRKFDHAVTLATFHKQTSYHVSVVSLVKARQDNHQSPLLGYGPKLI
jgi:hypothetical protein